MSKNLKQAANPIVVDIERDGELQGFLEICTVEIEWIDGKTYFKMTLKFPDGSFRQLFIHEKALLTKNGGTRFTSFADAEEAEIRKIKG